MKKVTQIGSRKSDHISINLEKDVRSGLTTGLERYRFIHRALPELDLENVSSSLTLFGRKLNSPILISSMTGGTVEAETINMTLAEAAEVTGIAMGVGSQRIAIENPEFSYSFKVRKVAPNILLFANLGAVQLNYGYDVSQCQRAVDMIGADALILHFNALQEAVQPGGDTRFAGLLSKIEVVCKSLKVPVIAKEVGWGFSKQDIKLLSSAGVAGIDVAGAGGTSWSQVEMYRAKSEIQARTAEAFLDWGIPTVDAIENVLHTAPDLLIIASGGIKTGVDIAKCLALGAKLGGMASIFLKAAVISHEETVDTILEIMRVINICMFATGSATLEQLNRSKLDKLDSTI
jgi:isopentenyl-diphosphate delta-isomerase